MFLKKMSKIISKTCHFKFNMGYTKNIMCCVVQNAFFELVCFMAFLLNKEILTKIIYDIGNT